MRESLYEFHNHKDPKFPIIFHSDADQWNRAVMDGMESMEILYFFHRARSPSRIWIRWRCRKGTWRLSIPAISMRSKRLPPLRTIFADSDKSFCEELGFYIDEQQLQE